MDQEKIGRFIAQCRKEQNLTQVELAEILNISDRSISKWENGKCMPDLSLFKPLCEHLGITINELLSGERLDSEVYQQKWEENMIINMSVLKKRMRKWIHKLFISSMTVIMTIIAILIGFMGYTEYQNHEIKLAKEKINIDICKEANNRIRITLSTKDGTPAHLSATETPDENRASLYLYRTRKENKDLKLLSTVGEPMVSISPTITKVYYGQELIWDDSTKLKYCE